MGMRSTRTSTASLAAAAGVAVLAFAGSAMAQYGPECFRIRSTTMVNGQPVNGEILITTDQGQWDGYDRFAWTLPAPITVTDPGSGMELFTLNSANLAIDLDPFVTANFNVTAGSLNTTFSVSSAMMSVAAGTYTGQASGQVTVTDGDGDGATLSVINGAGLYRAMYNGTTVFTNLFASSVTAGSFSSAVSSDSFGPAPIGVAVSDISAEYIFSLTPNDTATGTSNFTIIPTPGGVALLGLGGMAMARRRRAR